MKKLTLIFTLLVSTAMVSSPSYAEWTKVSLGVLGDTTYVDFTRIRKQYGYNYVWVLLDYGDGLEDPNGILSAEMYLQVDCKVFRYKIMSDTYYDRQMGQGEVVGESSVTNEEWDYPKRNSMFENTLNAVCVH